MTSIATYIRDQTFNRLVKLREWGDTRKVPLPPVQGNQFPIFATYLIREDMSADGDANVGPPHYLCSAIIGISVIDEATKPEVLEGSLDGIVDDILDTLFEDITYVNLRWTDGETQLIEGFPQVSRSYFYPQDGEHYFMECRLQLTVNFRVNFIPTTPNSLTEIDITVSPFKNTVQSDDYTVEIELPQGGPMNFSVPGTVAETAAIP